MLTEQIFTIPGFGKLIIDAVFNRDYAVVQGVVLVTATTYITLNLHGRRALRAGQSAAEGLMADVPYDSALVARRADETVESPMRRALRRLKRRKGAVVGLVVIALFVVLAVFAPLISPYDPAAQSWTSVRKAPSGRTGSAPTMSGATCSRA